MASLRIVSEQDNALLKPEAVAVKNLLGIVYDALKINPPLYLASIFGLP